MFTPKKLALALGVAMTLTACISTDNSATVAPSADTPKVMAYGRFVPERQDDFTWENDKVAFRVYGPAGPKEGHFSGVDAWLKRVDYSIIDKWYKKHVDGGSYHKDEGEGYDPYHVGDSRGLGSTAIWVNGTPYPAGTYKSYKLHESGADKVKFTLEYEWQTPLGLVHESKTISLGMGTQLFDVSSMFTLDGKPAKLPIAIGITTHDDKASVAYNKDTGRISAWEKIHDIGLGTGVVIKPGKVNDIKHISSAEKDKSHIWLFTETCNKGHLKYQAGYGWAARGDISTDAQWQKYLDQQ